MVPISFKDNFNNLFDYKSYIYIYIYIYIYSFFKKNKNGSH